MVTREWMTEPRAVDQRALHELVRFVEPALVHPQSREPYAGEPTHGRRRTGGCCGQALIGLVECTLRVQHPSGHRQTTGPDPIVRRSVERLLGEAERQPVVAPVVLDPRLYLERLSPAAVLDRVLGVGSRTVAVPSRDPH